MTQDPVVLARALRLACETVYFRHSDCCPRIYHYPCPARHVDDQAKCTVPEDDDNGNIECWVARYIELAEKEETPK